MPAFLLPAIAAGLGALGGIGGNKSSGSSESTQNLTSEELINRLSNFGQSSQQGIAPQFQGTANDILKQFFQPAPSAQFIDPAQFTSNFFNRNAQRVNDASQNTANETRARLVRQGLGNSSASTLSRAIGEIGRQSGITDVAGQTANQELAIRQLNDTFRNNAAQIAAQNRSVLTNLFGALPRTSDTSGFSNLDATSSQNRNVTTNTTQRGKAGSSLGSILGGALGGLSSGGSLLGDFFGGRGGNSNQTNLAPFFQGFGF